MDDRKAFKILSATAIVIAMTIIIFNAWISEGLFPTYKEYNKIFHLSNHSNEEESLEEDEFLEDYEEDESGDGEDEEDEVVLVNINEADIDELLLIPYVGEVLAERIIDYREEYGDFESIDELLEIDGIGEKKLEKMAEYIVLE